MNIITQQVTAKRLNGIDRKEQVYNINKETKSEKELRNNMQREASILVNFYTRKDATAAVTSVFDSWDQYSSLNLTGFMYSTPDSLGSTTEEPRC